MKTAPEPALPTFATALRQGLTKGLLASLGVIKVMLPITLVVSLMKVTPLLGWLAEAFRPVMGLFGLRGETALPFILGGLLNLYVAIGAMIPLGLTSRETTILAAMLLIAHNLPVETAIIKASAPPGSPCWRCASERPWRWASSWPWFCPHEPQRCIKNRAESFYEPYSSWFPDIGPSPEEGTRGDILWPKNPPCLLPSGKAV